MLNNKTSSAKRMDIVKFLLPAYFIFLLPLLPAYGQGVSRIDENKPSIFISFEKFGARKPVYVSESDKGINFRLTNNSNAAINLGTDGLYLGPFAEPFTGPDGRILGFKNNAEIGLSYGIQRSPGPRTKKGGGEDFFGYSATSARGWLAPGRSIIFSIPREQLVTDSFLYIIFKYDWELGKKMTPGDEPEHMVKFDYSSLP